ncbi:hypothetical protein [Lutibacter sp.]|uniref:hypothetical protein n=1 Tax=Lutibacter sp. TaxID=1925666 RepID=UPI0025C1E704|nr:hypothetical protein [Lutibacter sp.]MCF6168924.1 hypothetical protein [Lutibacter sp.]
MQGIQSYIFATNKLKQIIGASEIIEQLCTTWFDDFLDEKELTGIKYWVLSRIPIHDEKLD